MGPDAEAASETPLRVSSALVATLESARVRAPRRAARFVWLLLASACVPDLGDFVVGDSGVHDATTGVPLDALVDSDDAIDLGPPRQCMVSGDCDRPLQTCLATAGSCEAGVCIYPPQSGQRCDDDDGCTTSDKCAYEGVCRGVAKVCAPRASECRESTAVVFTDGACSSGECVYTESMTYCQFGCSAGRCLPETCVPHDWRRANISELDASEGGDFEYVSDAAGTDHVLSAARDGNGEHNGIDYLYRPRRGDWTLESVEPGGIGTYYRGLALAVELVGRVHAVYARQDGELVHAVRSAPGVWTRSRIADGTAPTLAFASDGTAHVIFAMTGGLAHAERAPGATEWTVTQLRRTLDDFTRNAVGNRALLAVGSSGVPHFVYDDIYLRTLTHAWRDGTEWEHEDIFTSRVLPGSFDFVMDSSDGMHLSVGDDTGKNLYYVSGTSAGPWQVHLLHGGTDNVGDVNAIVLDPSGGVYIAYRSHTYFETRYAFKPPGGAWGRGLLDTYNGFPFGGWARADGTVGFVYHAVPPFSRETLRTAERRDCP